MTSRNNNSTNKNLEPFGSRFFYENLATQAPKAQIQNEILHGIFGRFSVNQKYEPTKRAAIAEAYADWNLRFSAVMSACETQPFIIPRLFR